MPSDEATLSAISSIFDVIAARISKRPTKKWAFAHSIGSTLQDLLYRGWGEMQAAARPLRDPGLADYFVSGKLFCLHFAHVSVERNFARLFRSAGRLRFPLFSSPNRYTPIAGEESVRPLTGGPSDCYIRC